MKRGATGIENLSEDEVLTVVAYAHSNMNVHETSRRCYCHRGTVEYRLRRVKEKTGLDPRNFFELIKLLYGIGVVNGSM